MIALLRKELRELALPALALVLCAVLIAGSDLLYNRVYPLNGKHGFSPAVWLVISVALSFLGGGMALARESRQRLIFLTAWPQSRSKVWLAKSLVSFVVTMAVIAIGFWVCLGAVRWGGLTLPEFFVHEAQYGLLPLCFLLGLLWSGVVPSVLGAAALGFATSAGLVYGMVWFYILYLPGEWGPYVTDLRVGGWQYKALPIAIPLFVGWWAFARTPLLEAKRRVLVTVGLFVGLVLLGNASVVAQMVLQDPPALDTAVAHTGLAGGGQYRYYLMDAHGVDAGGLWGAPVSGGAIRRVARGKVYVTEPLGNDLIFTHAGMGVNGGRYTNWQVQFPSLRLRRLPDSPVYSPGTRPGREPSS